MTERLWLMCDDPVPMLERLTRSTSDRKLRLFACACARRLWPFLTERCCLQAILAAEQYADGAATKRQMGAARTSMPADFRNRRRIAIFDQVWTETADADQAEARARAWAGAWDTVHYCLRAVAQKAAELAVYQRLAAQAELVREIFGNPFRPAEVDSAWLAWNNGTVVQLAQAAYDERQLPAGTLGPSRLALLADACEDAGCDSSEVLNHLRHPGIHVRGCFVLDLILGKG